MSQADTETGSEGSRLSSLGKRRSSCTVQGGQLAKTFLGDLLTIRRSHVTGGSSNRLAHNQAESCHMGIFKPSPLVSPTKKLRAIDSLFPSISAHHSPTSSDSPNLSGSRRLRVQSRSSTRLRIAASVAFLFRTCFKISFRDHSTSIAQLSPLSSLG